MSLNRILYIRNFATNLHIFLSKLICSYFFIFSSETLQELMFVCHPVSELRFYGCCHPSLSTSRSVTTSKNNRLVDHKTKNKNDLNKKQYSSPYRNIIRIGIDKTLIDITGWNGREKNARVLSSYLINVVGLEPMSSLKYL